MFFRYRDWATKMMTLSEARASIGQDVLYHPPSGGDAQRGVIANVDDMFVYVRYGEESRAKGTSPDQLTPYAK